ncbi:MAG: NAD-dependent epimerase/dehydratase family protein [Candidatus Synoicihabitans palmerolidicus]|nr:NAD-dependent epimerase/dehydratase family protein [Candidatus Synoicihabitans palmerolidicus]
MNLLFIGGTGIISTACTQLALDRSHQISVLNRGQRALPPRGVEHLVGDLSDESAITAILQGRVWDAVVDFTCFTLADMERRIEWFSDRTNHFVFISSASTYQKPPQHYLITEDTPLKNPYWDYSRDKIVCEQRLLKAVAHDRFPGTIVRPSLTFDDSQITLAFNSWQRSSTAIDPTPPGSAGPHSRRWTHPLNHHAQYRLRQRPARKRCHGRRGLAPHVRRSADLESNLRSNRPRRRRCHTSVHSHSRRIHRPMPPR